MGLLGKLVGVAVGTVGAAVMSKISDKKTANLDAEFNEYTENYKNEKRKLEKRAAQGSRSAEHRLSELNAEYQNEKKEYDAKRQKLFPKDKKTAEERKMELESELKVKEMQAKHAMELEKMEMLHELNDKASRNVDCSPQQNTPTMTKECNEKKEINGITCVSCGKSLPNEAKFCSSCGSAIKKQEKFCITCGAKMESDATFCISCGAKLL